MADLVFLAGEDNITIQVWPCGLMDKAPALGTTDSRLELLVTSPNAGMVLVRQSSVSAQDRKLKVSNFSISEFTKATIVDV